MNNKKVKDILESMGLEVAVYDGDNYCGEGFDFRDFKYFAELIVCECVNKCRTKDGERIQKYFGADN